MPGRVVVDQVALELLDLLVGQRDLGELADAGVDPVHDLVGRELVVEHRAARRMRSRASGASSTRSPSRAIRTRRSIVREDPSIVIVNCVTLLAARAPENRCALGPPSNRGRAELGKQGPMVTPTHAE